MLPVLVISHCHNKIPQDGRFKQQAFISHSSRGWEVQDQGAGMVGSGKSCVLDLQMATFSLCPHMAGDGGFGEVGRLEVGHGREFSSVSYYS